jgi:Electron transfer DM13
MRTRLLVGGGVALAALIVFVLVWFEPQALVLDDKVDEAATTDTSAKTVAVGSFVSQEHTTSGQALVVDVPGGGRTLRFEGFDTSNGPDLRVYLSTAQADADWKAFDDDFVELGKLKGNKGDQNYEIPAGLDLGKYGRAVIWCKRFSVPFGVAALSAQSA